jgi:glycosyltransferase involved in cell wall biosynthesis
MALQPVSLTEDETRRKSRTMSVNSHRVLMLAYLFPPVAGAGTFRTARFARYLPKFGWTPIVVSIRPESAGEPRDDSLYHLLPEKTVVRRTTVWNPEQALANLWPTRWRISKRRASPTPNGNEDGATGSDAATTNDHAARTVERLDWKQLARHLRDLALYTPDKYVWWIKPAIDAACKMIPRWTPEVIYSTGPPHSTHLIAGLLKWKSRLPWVADFRDPWARKPWGYKVRNPWGQRTLSHFERLCIRAADVVILNTDLMVNEFRTHYKYEPPEKFVAIPNGYDPALLPVGVAAAAVTTGPELKRIVLCHPGSLYRKRDPRPLLLAMRQLLNEQTPVAFQQIGMCDPRFELSGFLREHGLDSAVHCESAMPHQEVLQSMQKADILVIVQPETAMQIPGKLFEMLLMRKPILALTDAGATADVVSRYSLGVVASPKDPVAIANAIRNIVLNRASCAAAGWDQALEAFDGERLTGLLAQQFSRVSRANVVFSIG